MFFIIQRSDFEIFAPAIEIDLEYAKALKIAVKAGVEVLAMQAKVTTEQIELIRKILSKFRNGRKAVKDCCYTSWPNVNKLLSGSRIENSFCPQGFDSKFPLG